MPERRDIHLTSDRGHDAEAGAEEFQIQKKKFIATLDKLLQDPYHTFPDELLVEVSGAIKNDAEICAYAVKAMSRYLETYDASIQHALTVIENFELPISHFTDNIAELLSRSLSNTTWRDQRTRYTHTTSEVVILLGRCQQLGIPIDEYPDLIESITDRFSSALSNDNFMGTYSSDGKVIFDILIHTVQEPFVFKLDKLAKLNKHDVVGRAFVKLLNYGYEDRADALVKSYEQSGGDKEALFRNPLVTKRIRDLVFDTIIGNNEGGYADMTKAMSIVKHYDLDNETALSVVYDGAVALLNNLRINDFYNLKYESRLPHTVFQSALSFVCSTQSKIFSSEQIWQLANDFELPEEQLMVAAMAMGTKAIVESDWYALENVKKVLVDPYQLQIAAQDAMLIQLRQGQRGEADETTKEFTISKEVVDPASPLFIYFDEDASREIRLAKETYAKGVEPADQKARLLWGIAPSDAAFFRQRDPEVLCMDKEDKPQYEVLAAAIAQLEHDEHVDIAEYIRICIKMFGPKATMQYINRPDLSLHDAFEFFPAMRNIFERCGLSPQVFAHNILLQVAKDGGVYDEGTAHHCFAFACRQLEALDVGAILDQARTFTTLPALQALVANFTGDQGPFSSWKMLKKFLQIVNILQRQDLLAELASGDTSPAMRNYVERLAFHPNIDAGVIMQFWKNTRGFLEIDDTHTDAVINEVKKPSNYLSLPHLGLTAEDLRDALVEGSMDKIQTLPPMAADYYFGIPLQEDIDVSSGQEIFYALCTAIGQKKLGIIGAAVNPQKLFSEIQTWCTQEKISWTELWSKATGAACITALSTTQKTELVNKIFDRTIGIRDRQLSATFRTYRMTISPKSDPESVVAGNDTASCMPFGSGKNNVYMFNPNCAQAVVQRRTSEGRWRTAAQSVMHIDAVASRSTSELIESYKMAGIHLKDLLTEQDLTNLPVVTCDNIEIAKNAEGQAIQEIRECYQQFFREYLRRYASILRLDPTRVAVGQGYTPESLGLKATENHFVPLAPMGYSDNVKALAYIIETGLPNLTEAQANSARKAGVAAMSSRDVLAVAVLEGKAYHDNVSLIESLHGVQNNIIGMEIANAHKERPNLSFVFRNTSGAPKGYVIAYEGTTGKTTEGSQKQVYIADLAADPESKLAGGKLMQAFFEAYRANYGTHDKPFLPIFTNARDQTTYRILQSVVTRFAERTGWKVEIEDVAQYYRGEDLFHDIRISIGQTQEEINAQKLRHTL